MACLRNVRAHASHGCPSGRTRSEAIAAAPGAYGSGTNVRGSGLIRTSPTGPMPSTGWRWSSMFIAIIATVCPIPLAIRASRPDTCVALPRMIPPWSAYRNRISEICPARARSSTVSATDRPGWPPGVAAVSAASVMDYG